MAMRRKTQSEDQPACTQESSNVLPGSEGSWVKLRKQMTFVHLTNDAAYDFAVSLAVIWVVVAAMAENCASTAYGRFGGETKLALDPRLGWWLMELPCSLVFIYQFFVIGGPQARKPVPRLMAVIFCLHYLYRGWIFPMLIRVHGNSNNFSIVPAIFSWGLTSTHAYLNAQWFASQGKHLTSGWLRTLRFWIGLTMYYSGFALIIWHDTILRELRPCPNGARYCVPTRGLFQYATCAHYFVELWAWAGFALLSSGPNGLMILLVSLGNLVPRSVATHNWYLEHFGEAYNQLGRQYLVPFVW